MHTHAHAHSLSPTHTLSSTHTYARTHTRACTCAHTHTHTYTYTYTHTHTHTHIHAQAHTHILDTEVVVTKSANWCIYWNQMQTLKECLCYVNVFCLVRSPDNQAAMCGRLRRTVACRVGCCIKEREKKKH